MSDPHADHPGPPPGPPTPAQPSPLLRAALVAAVALGSAAAAALGLVLARALSDHFGPAVGASAAPIAWLAAGLGAWAFGATAGRIAEPLGGLGLIALAAAVLGALARGALDALAAATPPGLGTWVGMWLVVGPPAFLAGGALALVAPASGGSGASAAERPRALPLLAAAGLGAALGLWTAGFAVVPAVGLAACGNLAVALALVAAVAVLALARAGGPPASREPREQPPSEAGAHLAALLVGAAAHALWRLGQRELATLAGPTARAAWAGSAAAALALGLGLLVASLAGARRARGLVAAGAALALVGVAAAQAARPALAELFAAVALQRAEPTRADRWLVGAALLRQASLAGAGLALGGLVAPRPLALGGTAARLLLGAALAGLALELAPLPPRALALWGAGVLVALAAASAPDARGSTAPAPRRVLVPLALAAAAALALALTTGRAPLTGPYLGREPGTGPSVQRVVETPAAELTLVERAPYSSSGAGAATVVLRADGRPVEGDAAPLALAWLTHAMAPGARTALVDGAGSGRLVRALLQLGGIEVTCAEPEVRRLELARELGPLAVTHAPEDLRAHLARERGPRYDLVLVDATAAWTRGAATRLSIEFYHAAAARLTPRGLLAVALSTRTLLSEQLARVLETAAAAFPEAALLDAGPGLVVLALAPRGLLPAADELAQARALIESSAVASAGLRATFGSADPRALLFERLWLGDARLRELALRLGTGVPLTDADLSLELGAFHPALMAHALGDALAERNELLIASAVDPEELRARFLDWRLDATQLDALRAHKTRFFRAGMVEQGLELVQLGLTYEPDDPELVADLLLFGQLEPGDFEARRRRLLMRSPRESYRLGASLAQLGRGAEALAVLSALAEAHPDSPAALLSLAEARERAGLLEAAADARARAAELDAGADPIFAR